MADQCYYYDNEMFGHVDAPTPKRQKSSGTSSARSLRVEKPFSGQVGPSQYNHRRKTTPAVCRRNMASNRSSGNIALTAPTADPSCNFSSQSCHYERPSTWHYNSYQPVTANARPATSFVHVPTSQGYSVNNSINDARFNAPTQWPAQNFFMRAKVHQSAPPSGQLLFNEIPQDTTWFDSTSYQSDGTSTTTGLSSFFLDPTPADHSTDYSLSSATSGAQPLQNNQLPMYNSRLSRNDWSHPPTHSHVSSADFRLQQPERSASSGVEKDLVGLGLYDKPAHSSPTLFDQRASFGSTSMREGPMGKQLKLAETWEPPTEQALASPEQVPEAEDDDGVDSPEDDVPQPTPVFFAQQPMLMQEPEKMVQAGLDGQSFLFDDEYDVNGTSWFQDTSYTSQVPFDPNQYGMFNNSYSNMW
ncbi:MAG: hypothetical protein M1828_006052 [Chrysothrix sp. TS-e1954]|nr:MAG: hypothetical protein M1828_006052 [Chrysothrix sp. TS-e1954]